MGFSLDTKTDEEIVLLVQHGDKEQFGVLVERYEKKILRYGKKFIVDIHEVEDITQDVFMNAYKNIKNFDHAQKFSPWLYRIAHNAFINGLKKNIFRPMVRFDFDTLVSHVVYEDPVQKEREQEEMRQLIDEVLDKLERKYKEVLVLYYQEELDYKEISEILKIPISTVGVRLTRGKVQLREIYKKINPEYGK